MKVGTGIGVAGALAVTLFSSAARAEVGGAKLLAFIAWQSDDACAASVEVTKSVGGLTDGTEALKLGLKSYSFASGSFSPGAGRFDVGARVLFGSGAFASQTGAKVDVTIPDADCKAFNASGGDITFDGSLGRNPALFKLTVPPAFGTYKALDGAGQTLDLTKMPLKFYGFTGSWDIGGAPPAGTSSGTSGTSGASGTTTSSSGNPQPPPSTSSSGGCVVAPSDGPSGDALLALPALAALAIVLRPRRRTRR